MPETPFVLHTTPTLGDLPASDTDSIYLIALLQLGCPGRFSVQTSDWASNGGKIPYLTHLDHLLRTRHLDSIPAFSDPNENLTEEESAENLAWTAYIQQNLTDLVNHTLYSLPPNYPVLAKAQIQDLTFPKTQYVPQRLRGIVKTRLEHVGLWGLGGLNYGEWTKTDRGSALEASKVDRIGDLVDEDRQRKEDKYITGPGGTVTPKAWSGWRSGKEFQKRTRERGESELLQRARAVFDPLARRLRDKLYFFGSRPSTADLQLLSHLAILLSDALPNALLGNLLRSTYPVLENHHSRLLHLLFPSTSSWNSVPRLAPSSLPSTPWGLSSFWPSWSSTSTETNRKPGDKAKTKKEKDFERGRWLWFLGAGVGMIGYLLASGIVQIEYAGPENTEDEDEVEVEEKTLAVVDVDDGDEVEEVVVVTTEDDGQ